MARRRFRGRLTASRRRVSVTAPAKDDGPRLRRKRVSDACSGLPASHRSCTGRRWINSSLTRTGFLKEKNSRTRRTTTLITMGQVLNLLGFEPSNGWGVQWYGSCPLHESRPRRRRRSFSVNVANDCHRCHGHGNPLELWAAATKLPLHQAAISPSRFSSSSLVTHGPRIVPPLPAAERSDAPWPRQSSCALSNRCSAPRSRALVARSDRSNQSRLRYSRKSR